MFDFLNYFSKIKLLNIQLTDYAIHHPNEKLPRSNELSAKYNISLNVVKNVCQKLAHNGYLKSNKKAGTKIISKLSKDQSDIYTSSKEKIKEIMHDMAKCDLNENEILSCIYSALSEFQFNKSTIIYTDDETDSLFIGKQELEDKLQMKVTALYINDVTNKLKFNTLNSELIIVPFYCSFLLDSLNKKIPIFPLKTTHPLEVLDNIFYMLANNKIVLIENSDTAKNRILGNIKNSKRLMHFHVYTIEEVKSNPFLLRNTHVVITMKNIYMNNKYMFKRIPNIISYNKFNDKEGFRMIKDHLHKTHSLEVI